MIRPRFVFSALLLIGFVHASDPITPQQKIDLLTEDDVTVHLNESASLSTEPDEIWMEGDDDTLVVSGKGMGYVRTNAAYRDYHLVIEYKWGERTLAGRADRARDCGLLIHSHGPDGAYGNTWMSCIEAQLIEGGSGDILVLAAEQEDGTLAPTRITAEIERDRDGEPIWTAGSAKETFPGEGKKMARVNWRDRDPDWADTRGYRGKDDIENPLGEWNRMEVLCEADSIRILLNGELINEVSDCHPTSGYIGLQSEYAECHIRRLDLYPLGKFQEKWEPQKRASDMGYSITGESILPRRFPLSPEESQAAWEIDGDYEIELVACEPLVNDPVDVVWDEHGRMFVAEMGDYPLPADDGPYLSRIRLLTDEDGDGRMDSATTWADDLDHVQGLLPFKGGLLVTTRTAILHLVDTDEDGRCDDRKTLFHSNEPRHNQLQVSSPRYGPDNRIYFSNGLDGKEIYPESDQAEVLEFSKLNLRYDPRDGSIEPIPGPGQFGGTLDAFGRHFYCSNRNPAMFTVMPLEAVQRNPLAGITHGHEDIQAPGARVHPIALSHTTSAAHAGTHTAACGLGIYLGTALPELSGDLFVCDPTAQLVTRNRLVPDGASFIAERVGNGKDFLASADEWARPVNVRNGPDGALYIVDMYRRFIDHSRFFPEEFSKTHYMRAGFDQGRIWRLVSKSQTDVSIPELPDDSAELVPFLAEKSHWHRIAAQRRLVEIGDKEVAPQIAALLDDSTSSTTMVSTLGALAGLGALTEQEFESALASADPGVIEFALSIAESAGFSDAAATHAESLLQSENARIRFLSLCFFPDAERSAEDLADILLASPTDDWFRKAIFSADGELAPEILDRCLVSESFLASENSSEAVRDLARHIAALGNLDTLASLLSRLVGEPEWWHFETVIGISEGLKRSSLPQKSLAALVSTAPPELGEAITILDSLLTRATETALDRDKPEADRISALELVSQRPFEEKLPVVEDLIHPSETPGVQAAAVRILSRDNRETVAAFFFERWKTLAPTPRREAIDLITSNTKSGLALMKKMKAGEISPTVMPPMTRWSYGRSTNEEIKTLALELFGSTDTDRAALIDEYRDVVVSHSADPARGELVFQKAACATCHKIGGIGVEVGPSLDDVKIKPAEALLTDILDPNRAVEERWVSQTVAKSDGTELSGIIHGEDAAAVVLRIPGGVDMTVPRTEVQSVQSTGMSLMPIGLEAAISKEEMADLIAFLKQR